MSAAHSAKERALRLIRDTARLAIPEIRDNPGAATKGKIVSKAHNRAGKGMKELQNAAKPPLGWIWGDFMKPWQRSFRADQNFNKDVHLKREYPPLSLIELQRLIDLGWINPTEPIDLTTLCNTGRYKCDPAVRQFGINLTDEGCNIFAACVHLEVQFASELSIATIERLGGVITTAYYDPQSLLAVTKPTEFFQTGKPIPRRAYPPGDLIEYYTDPKTRGYLADPKGVEWHRRELAAKYGYEYQPISPKMVAQPTKSAQQIFFGLEPGWVVNLPDKTILKPVDESLKEYYTAPSIQNLVKKELNIPEKELLFDETDPDDKKKKKKKKEKK